jgi:DNA-binding transcriptional ArsR family regulator
MRRGAATGGAYRTNRRAILARLALGESRVTDLAEPFDMSLPAVSKHLKVLEEAGLMKRRKDGRVHRCRLDPKPLSAAADWIAQLRAGEEPRPTP